MSGSRIQFKDIVNVAVIVAALGYFVDIYDLVLFSIVRKTSLQSLGIQGQAVMDKGVFLLNMQMGGMLVGGIIWGILGDKKGRLSILFGSIFLYSIANIANGFVHTLHAYAFLRLLAGLGLAGELGAGITLVSEILPKELRGYGTMIVASVGITGAILAGTVAEHYDWRTAYFIGGGLGLVLLVLRIGIFESGMFSRIKEEDVKRGYFISLFTNSERLVKYLKCIFIGLPIWFMVGILMTFSPEIAVALHIPEPVTAGKAIMTSYFGLVVGDFSSGFLSQVFKSRKKIVLLFLILTCTGFLVYFKLNAVSSAVFYSVCWCLGFAGGYWAIFVTIAAEQFGTNLRATVTTTVPNFVRGAVVPITLLFQAAKNHFGILGGAELVGVFCLAVAFIAAFGIVETFGKDLDFLETL